MNLEKERELLSQYIESEISDELLKELEEDGRGSDEPVENYVEG